MVYLVCGPKSAGLQLICTPLGVGTQKNERIDHDFGLCSVFRQARRGNKLDVCAADCVQTPKLGFFCVHFERSFMIRNTDFVFMEIHCWYKGASRRGNQHPVCVYAVWRQVLVKDENLPRASA